LTLFECGAVFYETAFAFDVGFCDCTTDDGEDRIGTFRSEFIGDESIEPACCDGVVFEGGSFEEFDEIFDCGTELSSNAEFFECDDHVFSGLRTIFAVRKDVTELTV
jgi:hypothetical protein